MTDAERERLYLLMEECCEVIQIAGKILRHGYDSYHPDLKGPDNREMLERELGDVLFAMRLMRANGDIKGSRVMTCVRDKALRIRRYLHNWHSYPTWGPE